MFLIYHLQFDTVLSFTVQQCVQKTLCCNISICIIKGDCTLMKLRGLFKMAEKQTGKQMADEDC